MRKTLLTLGLLCGLIGISQAQLPNGSLPPNFTATDINGNTYTLYDYLNQGKVVFIDFFATWCGPCWNYHNSHALADLYDEYGPNGTNQIMVFGIEADPATPVSAIYGIGSNTQGNWTTGTPYPIIDNASIGALYQISFYPTIYGICPTRIVSQVGQQNTAGLYAFAQNCPPLLPLQAAIQNVSHVTCFGNTNGSISLSSSGGANPISYHWSTGANTTQPQLGNLAKGNYYCTVTSGNNNTVVVGPISVQGPSSALNLSLVTSVPANCSGQNGSLTVSSTGGGTPYNYTWSNGMNTPTISQLTPGNYSVTVQDFYGCTKTGSYSVTPAQIPLANAGPQKTITCSQSVVTLNGTSSSTGAQYVYAWDTSDGHIVSGANTLIPQVDEPGTYTLTVLNTASNCSSTSTVVVGQNTTAPNINVASPAGINCTQSTVTLNGSGPAGTGFVKTWTTQDGHFVSGQNTYTPTVNQGGTYTLTVTSQSNGCVSTQSVTVVENTDLPEATAAGATLTCAQPVGQLSGSIDTPGATGLWTGPGGFSSGSMNPDVENEGTYTFTVTGANGCVSALQVQVVDNIAPPDVAVAAGTISCEVASVTLSATSDTPDVTFLWTNAGGETLEGDQPEVSEAGVYTLLATAPNGCTTTTNAEVEEDTASPTADAGADQLLNCNAQAVVLNGGGSSTGNGITYSWTTSDGNILSDANTPSPTVDGSGTYELLVTNTGNGCTATDQVWVDQNSDIAVALNSQSNVSCFDQTNGSASVIASGGSGEYNYEWSNGATGPTATDLGAGIYEVEVTDIEGCIADLIVIIESPALLEAQVSATGQSAFDEADGTANCTPVGGTAPYSFLWNNGATTATVTGLTPGNYSVEITDANGCTATQAVTVSSFDCTVAASISGQQIDCFGAGNGSAAVAIEGGTEPYEIAWSNNSTGPHIDGLTPGNYQVSITDDNNCPLVLGITISQPTALQPNLSVEQESSFGANDGSVALNPSGGSGAYSYLWNNGETGSSLQGLAPGTYSVEITDANGCSVTSEVEVEAFNCILNIDAQVIPVSCAGAADGQILVSPAAGYAPYVYQWSNGSISPAINNLSPGEYSLAITDDRNCPLNLTFEVQEPEVLHIDNSIISHPNCTDSNDGILVAQVSGGTAPYDYLWSNGQFTPHAVYLNPGSYTVSVTDANGCQTTSQIALDYLDNLPPQVLVNDITIALNANGVAGLNVAQIDNGSFDNCGIASMQLDVLQFDCNSLGQRFVTLIVVDENGNSASAVATVTVVDNLSPQLICPDNLVATCDGVAFYDLPFVSDNCEATMLLTNGFPSGFTFPTGETSVSYTATDAAGNTASCAFSVSVPEVFTMEADVNEVSCFGGSDGQVTLAVTGGEPPYNVQWSNGATGLSLGNLPAGTYTASVTDAAGCVSTQSVEVIQPDELVISGLQTTAESNNGANGSIDITVNGGTAPYTYRWRQNGEIVSEVEDPTQLRAGAYEVLVTDANGCTFLMTNVVVDQVTGIANVTLENLLRLMPNPASDYSVLHCPGGLPIEVDIDIMDAAGRVIQRLGYFEPGATHIPIDLNEYVSGIYLIRIRSSEGLVVKKFVIEK